MPYLSHPVRRLRDDPTPGETVDLVVTAAETDAEAVDVLVSRLSEAGATVQERLRFGAVRVRVPQEDVAAVCRLDGIDTVETAATRDLAGGDAGEDV
jgi:hypothetical protein